MSFGGLPALGAGGFFVGLGRQEAFTHEAMQAPFLSDDVAIEAERVPTFAAGAKRGTCAAKLLHEACGFLSWVWLALAGELRDSVAILWRVPVVLEPRYVSLQYINGS